MNAQIRAQNLNTLLARKISRFSELEVALRSILKADIVPKESRNVITSFAAYLHVKHLTEEETSLIDILTLYVEELKAKRSTWWDPSNIKVIDAVNDYVTELVYLNEQRNRDVA